MHAVVRLDGANGFDDAPPPWADVIVLTDVVRTAAAAVRLTVPYHQALGEYELRWGTQLDARPLYSQGGADALNDDAVAAYVAKYVTKGAAEVGAGLDHPVQSAAEIARAQVSPHVRSLMAACWRLGGLPVLESMRLRAWAHSLGYRGHVLTKSRVYSTTYAALRDARTEHRSRSSWADTPDATTLSRWHYAGSGHPPRCCSHRSRYRRRPRSKPRDSQGREHLRGGRWVTGRLRLAGE